MLSKWLHDHRGPDWAILIIRDDLTATYISEGIKTVQFTITDPYALSGIHVRDLLIIVDLEGKPQHVRDMVASLNTSKNSQVVHPDDA